MRNTVEAVISNERYIILLDSEVRPAFSPYSARLIVGYVQHWGERVHRSKALDKLAM